MALWEGCWFWQIPLTGFWSGYGKWPGPVQQTLCVRSTILCRGRQYLGRPAMLAVSSPRPAASIAITGWTGAFFWKPDGFEGDMKQITLLATGERLVGRGVRAFNPVLEEILRSASREIQIAVYRVDISALPLLDILEEATHRGVRVLLILSALNEQPEIVQRKLFHLSGLPGAQVVDFRLEIRGSSPRQDHCGGSPAGRYWIGQSDMGRSGS